MKLREVMAYADELRPNDFSENMKVQWLNEIEGMVQTNVMLLTQDTDLTRYTWDQHRETEMLAKFPHDKIYWAYLIAMIDYANGDLDKYQNDMALFNERWGEYMRWYARTYRPADGGMVAHGYYLSAYSIAVMHGFDGTEEEWLESLVGPQGAAFTYDDFTEEQLAGLQGPQGEQGPRGIQGEPGYAPVRGVDYWTETDQEELKKYVDETVGNMQTAESEIFIAEYGVTDVEDVVAAYHDGKTVICKYKERIVEGDVVLQIPLCSYSHEHDELRFSATTENRAIHVYLNGGSDWSAETHDLTCDKVFIAEYDETTWEELCAECDAGKVPFCYFERPGDDPGEYHYIPLYKKTDNVATFRAPGDTTMCTLHLYNPEVPALVESGRVGWDYAFTPLSKPEEIGAIPAEGKSIGANQDMDDYTEPGSYIVNTENNKTLGNRAFDTSTLYRVTSFATMTINERILQEAFVNSTAYPAKKYRVLSKNGWSEWKSGTTSLADIGAAAAVHKHAIADVTGLQDELDELKTWQGTQGEPGADGKDGSDGATFTPSVSSAGLLSWTNDKGLTNPAAVNIKGPKGDKGEKGADGEKGEKGDTGATGATGPQGEPGADGKDGATGPQGIQGEKGENGYTPVRGKDYWTEADKTEIQGYVDEAVGGIGASRIATGVYYGTGEDRTYLTFDFPVKLLVLSKSTNIAVLFPESANEIDWGVILPPTEGYDSVEIGSYQVGNTVAIWSGFTAFASGEIYYVAFG